MKNTDQLSLTERVKAPTPQFFRKLRTTVAKVGAVAGTLLALAAAGKITLPGKAGKVLEVVVTASAVAAAVASATVETKPEDEPGDNQ